MASTRRKQSSENQIDWFLTHADYIRLRQNRARAPEVVEFVNFLWPIANPYSSPLNSAMMTGITDEQLSSQSVWFARDGLVPLMWFYKAFPRPPKKFNGWMFVQEEFAPLVPAHWRAMTGTYRVVSSLEEEESVKRDVGAGRKKILLVGLLMDGFCTPKAMRRIFRQLHDTYSAQELAKADIKAFLPPRYEGFGNEHLHDMPGKLISEICRALGPDVDFLRWGQVENQESFADFEVWDLNEKLLCADNFLVHHVLGKGARLPGPSGKAPDKSAKFVRLSPYHGVAIKSRLPGSAAKDEHPLDDESLVVLEKYQQVMRSEVSRRFPWPAFFGTRISQIARSNAAESDPEA